MSLAAFGGGFLGSFNREHDKITDQKRVQAETERKDQLSGIGALIKDPNTDPKKIPDLMRLHLKLQGHKPADIETIMGVHDAVAKSHGLTKEALAQSETPADSIPSAPAKSPDSSETSTIPTTSATPTSPLPQPSTSELVKGESSPTPTPSDALPTIGSSTQTQASPITDLPESGVYDQNRGINKTTRQASQMSAVKVSEKKQLDLHDEEMFNRRVDQYKSEYGTDPSPEQQKAIQEDVKDARAIKMGLPSRANYSGQTVTGAELKRVFGSETLPDGSPINDNGSYNPVLRGTRIIDAHERATPNIMRKVYDDNSPTKYSYANAQGQIQTGAPPPAGLAEKQTVREQAIRQNDGSILIRPMTSMTSPVMPGAKSTATPTSPLPQRSGPAGPSMMKAVKQGVLIPSPGGRPLTTDQAAKMEMNNQAGKSMVNTMADVNKNVNMLTDLMNAGKITIATDPGDDGAIHFVVSGEASRSLTPEQAKFAGDLQHLEEAINWIRGPMGSAGFRGKEAWNAIQASGVKRSASPDQIRQTMHRTMDFTLRQLAIQDKTLAKSKNQMKPEMSVELANAYLQVYGTRTEAEKAAKSAGYSLE